MIFDAHSDYLYYLVSHQKEDVSKLSYEDGAILNYYFKGSESYDHFLFVLEEIKKIKKQLPPFYCLGIEGLGPMKKMEDVSLLKQAGIRSVTLTWNDENKWATGTYQNKHHGLTRQGKLLLKKLEENEFYVDLSHANEKTFWQILSHFKGKIFASHSNCYALCPNERNLSDEQIFAIASRGGVIGVNAYAPFVGGNEDIDALIRHLEHIRNLVGIQVPCFGFDFDDYLSTTPSTIKGLFSKKDIPHLIDGLRRHGWSQEDIDAVSYKNICRFLNL